MGKKRLETIYATCVGKQGFLSLRLAQAALKGHAAPYKCPFCSLWHLGHERYLARTRTHRKVRAAKERIAETLNGSMEND